MADKLTPQQEAAVWNRGGKLLVSAAAGSGKTKVLVDRLLSYVMDSVSPANIDDFLIITYTKAAAAELRGKISARLTEVLAQDPNNKRLQQQIQRLYLTKISTVHAFCTDVLREYAYRLDIPGDFRVADENECMELQLKAVDQVLNDAYDNEASDPAFFAFIDSQGFGRDDRQVVEILLKVYNSAKCHLDPDGWLDWCVDTCSAEASSRREGTVWSQYLMDDLKSFLELHIQSINNCIQAAAEAGNFAKPLDLLIQTVSQLRLLKDSTNWDEVRKNSAIDYGRLVFDKSVKDSALAQQIKAVRNACKSGLEKKLRRFSDSYSQVIADSDKIALTVKGLVKLVCQFSVKYDKMKKARRILDFGDLEHKMLDLVYGKKRDYPTAVATELGRRFREVMVDEYQDSNAVQDAIFYALTLENQNCFMVGDVKQSIYQFRLADPGIFLNKYNTYQTAEDAMPGMGRKLLLTRNFRSSGAVIEAVNDVFRYCMSEEVGGLEYGDDEKLYEGVEHVPISDPQVELHCIEVREDTYLEEAEFTANRILELLDGKHMVRQKDGLRPIVADDIVILLRSPGSVGEQFRYALEQKGIRCATGGSVDLLQTEEVSVLRSLLKIISNPLQDIPLVGVITSRIFEFTADELAYIRGSEKKVSIYQALQRSNSEKAKEFLDVLNQLRYESRICELSTLLEKILYHTRLDSIYGALPDGDVRKSNLQAFYRIVSDYESSGYRSLVHFLAHLDAMEEKGISVPAEAGTGGCVTIMSIHKSKGLEFPVVFLCGLSRDFNKESVNATVLCDKELGLGVACIDSKNRARYPSIAKRAIATKILSESLSEELRVLYVAMTRAKDRLIMTYASKYLVNEIDVLLQRMHVTDMRLLCKEASCPGQWILLSALNRTEAGALFALSDAVNSGKVSNNPWKITVTQVFEQDSCVQEESLEKNSIDPELSGKIKSALTYVYPYSGATKTPSKQTATQLKGRIIDHEIAEGTRTQSFERNWRKPSFIEENMEGTFFGNAVHAVMQYIHFESCTSLAQTQKEIQRLVQEGYISEKQAELTDAGKIMRFFESEVGQKLRSHNHVLREFKFSILEDASKYFPGTEDEKILLQGIVDCAMVDDDGIVIVDFKTDRVTEEGIAFAAQKYSHQVSAYSDALSRIFGLPIKSKLLYFFHLDRFATIQ